MCNESSGQSPIGQGRWTSARDGHTEVATRVARPCSVRRGAGGHVLACAARRLPLGRRGASTGAAAPHLERPPAHPFGPGPSPPYYPVPFGPVWAGFRLVG